MEIEEQKNTLGFDGPPSPEFEIPNLLFRSETPEFKNIQEILESRNVINMIPQTPQRIEDIRAEFSKSKLLGRMSQIMHSYFEQHNVYKILKGIVKFEKNTGEITDFVASVGAIKHYFIGYLSAIVLEISKIHNINAKLLNVRIVENQDSIDDYFDDVERLALEISEIILKIYQHNNMLLDPTDSVIDRIYWIFAYAPGELGDGHFNIYSYDFNNHELKRFEPNGAVNWPNNEPDIRTREDLRVYIPMATFPEKIIEIINSRKSNITVIQAGPQVFSNIFGGCVANSILALLLVDHGLYSTRKQNFVFLPEKGKKKLRMSSVFLKNTRETGLGGQESSFLLALSFMLSAEECGIMETIKKMPLDSTSPYILSFVEPIINETNIQTMQQRFEEEMALIPLKQEIKKLEEDVESYTEDELAFIANKFKVLKNNRLKLQESIGDILKGREKEKKRLSNKRTSFIPFDIREIEHEEIEAKIDFEKLKKLEEKQRITIRKKPKKVTSSGKFTPILSKESDVFKKFFI